MIELNSDQLVFSFPEVHPAAVLRIEFQRTLRIPDDGKTYPLPPGLGRFPLRHTDDHHKDVPAPWLTRGGVMLPMYQSEALWIYFVPEFVADRGTSYPFAVKVATGKINAVSGKEWSEGLNRSPQDYAVTPGQPWLDGYCVKKGLIRQFVAMPLGAGYSAEEQITGKAEYGGLQILVHPMKPEVFERRFPIIPQEELYARGRPASAALCLGAVARSVGMGLAPGGLMRQEIYQDPFAADDWHLAARSRCFAHIANSLVWRSITGSSPPLPPPTAKHYSAAGLPWFDFYAENLEALEGSKTLDNLKSVATKGAEKGDVPLPENDSVEPGVIVKLRRGLKPGQVREGVF
jgi:hypothetical protein